MNGRSFGWESEQFSEGGNIPSKDCADMIFINSGTEPAKLNGVPILPNGGSLTLPAFGPEVQKRNYRLTFGDGGGTQEFYVIRKFYD